jgi:hypothetical protein
MGYTFHGQGGYSVETPVILYVSSHVPHDDGKAGIMALSYICYYSSKRNIKI